MNIKRLKKITALSKKSKDEKSLKIGKDVVLFVKDLHKTFVSGDDKLEILKGADIEVKKGEIVALIGPSGSGKSTLLHIAGLLDSVDKGSIYINGKSCSNLSDEKKDKVRLNNIGFVYQTHNLLSDFSAVENVMIPLLVKGMDNISAKKKAVNLLSKMGLKARAEHMPAKLSGGERQRVAIARALINNPDILFADEPTGSLDPVNSGIVFDEFVALVKKTGLSALIATHNPTLAKKADRKIALIDGKLVEVKKGMKSSDFLKSFV